MKMRNPYKYFTIEVKNLRYRVYLNKLNSFKY